MESRLKIPLSDNENIPKNLFLKPCPSSEDKTKSSKEQIPPEKLVPKKQLSSCIYYRKFPKFDDKKIKVPTKLRINSSSEIRLPLDFIDLSYDSKKNE